MTRETAKGRCPKCNGGRTEWLTTAKNTLRLLEHTADRETGISRAIIKQNAAELRQNIQAEERAGR